MVWYLKSKCGQAAGGKPSVQSSATRKKMGVIMEGRAPYCEWLSIEWGRYLQIWTWHSNLDWADTDESSFNF